LRSYLKIQLSFCPLTAKEKQPPSKTGRLPDYGNLAKEEKLGQKELKNSQEYRRTKFYSPN